MCQKKSFIVGIAGGTGSGKTTLARSIIFRLAPCAVACVDADAYYRDLSHLTPEQRTQVNFDHPDALDTQALVRHIALLKDGHSIEKFSYDFVTHSRQALTVTLQPQPVVLVDGILIFAIPEVCRLFDLKIFIDEDTDIRLLRRIKRDMRERGRTIDDIAEQYINSVRPMHLEHVEPSKDYADIVVRSDTRTDEIISLLREKTAI